MTNAAVIKIKKAPSASRRRIIKKIILYTLMTLIAVIMLFPFYYSLVSSSRRKYDMENFPTRLWPEQFTFENYRVFFNILKNTLKVPIGSVLSNTIFITFAIILLSLFFCSMAAYSMARLNWRGKKVVLKVFFASMMIPGVVSMVPNYEILRNLNLLNNKWGLIIPGAISIYGILFLRSFFLATPKEVAEAGRIDGAGELRIFLTFYMRMILPGVITLGLFTFNSNWNSFLWPRIVLGTNKQDWVLAIVIREFQTIARPDLTNGPGPMMAAAIVTIIPTVVLFLIAQKFFMDNLAFTGIK